MIVYVPETLPYRFKRNTVFDIRPGKVPQCDCGAAPVQVYAQVMTGSGGEEELQLSPAIVQMCGTCFSEFCIDECGRKERL